MTGDPAVTAIRLHPDDDVICLLRDHEAGELPVVEGIEAPCLSVSAPLGHKIALRNMEIGAVVRKYGYPIGRATKTIAAGDHVHLHNLRGLGADRNDTSGH